jgi:hypothetical protein
MDAAVSFGSEDSAAMPPSRHPLLNKAVEPPIHGQFL